MNNRVAIQGIKGCFHQSAAEMFFGSPIIPVECLTFRQLIDEVKNISATDAAVMAIENSIAGSILPNYNLLRQSDLKIVGEIYLQIRQNLLVNKEVELKDIKEVHSHPMALQQCLPFLNEHKWKLVETEDTAFSAKYIAQHHCKHIAAIAGETAANEYGLKILQPDIQSEQHNYTRFLVLKKAENTELNSTADKASVYFHAQHKKGSLAQILTTIAEQDINLSKLQSFPVPGSNWEYSFHADLEFDSIEQFRSVEEKLQSMTKAFKVYGIYKNGLK
jgi:prephenate dehydratase